MHKLFFFLILITIFSCQNPNNYSEKTILEDKKVNYQNLQNLEDSEKALITMYLFAYGNSCQKKNNKIKCQILNYLKIKNECETTHISFLKKWFKNDKLMLIKLNNCPFLPQNSAIQNQFETIKLSKKQDTLIIIYNIRGLNNLQEKSWNISRKDKYLIKTNSLIKV